MNKGVVKINIIKSGYAPGKVGVVTYTRVIPSVKESNLRAHLSVDAVEVALT